MARTWLVKGIPIEEVESYLSYLEDLVRSGLSLDWLGAIPLMWWSPGLLGFSLEDIKDIPELAKKYKIISRTFYDKESAKEFLRGLKGYKKLLFLIIGGNSLTLDEIKEVLGDFYEKIGENVIGQAFILENFEGRLYWFGVINKE